MVEKSSIFMMLLIVTALLLVGISSIIYKPANGALAQPNGPAIPGVPHTPRIKEPVGTGVKPPITQQQEQKLLQLTPKALGKGQQQTGITGTFLMYASSDGKACIVYATISTRLRLNS